MKFINILVFLLAALALGGCASTGSAPSDSGETSEDPVPASEGRGSLMDRYISGEIPGYRE